MAILDGAPRRRHRHRQRLVSRRPEARPGRAPVSRSRVRSPTWRRSSATSGRCSSCRSSAGASTRRSGRSTKTMRSNEDYDFWLRAAIAGFTFARNDTPLGHYRVRTDSLSASNVRMLRGILHVYTKLRPVIAQRPREMAILDRQITPLRGRIARRRGAARARDRRLRSGAGAPRRAARPPRRRRRSAWRALLARWSPSTLKRHDPVQAPRPGRTSAPVRPCCRTAMKYSVVIATYNRAGDLRDTLAQPRRPAPDGAVGSHRRRQQLDRRHAPVVEPRRCRSPRRCATVRARAGAQPRAERRHRPRAGRDHRHDRRRRAGRTRTGWIAPPAALDAARMRLRRRPRAADLGRTAAGLAAQSRRQALGGDRAARLRRPSRSSSARACRSASTWRSGASAFERAGTVRSGHRTQGRHAARPGSARVVHPRARRRRPRLLRAGDWSVRHIIPASRLNKAYFRRWFYWRGISRAMLYEQGRPRHGSAGADDARLPHRAARVRRAALPVSQGAGERARQAARRALRGDGMAAFDHELWVWFFAGIVRSAGRAWPRGEPSVASAGAP